MAVILAKKIAELFLMILFGYLVVKMKAMKSEDSKALSSIALYVISPCVTINAFQIQPSADVQKGLIFSFAVALVLHIVFIVLSWLLGKVFHFNGVEKASIIYPNSGALVIPLVIALFGKEWVAYSSGYTMIQVIFLWVHGRMILCDEKSVDLKKILCSVNIMAIVAGILLFVFRIRLPKLILDAIDPFSTIVGPFAMIAAGMIIAGMDLKKLFFFKRIYLVAFFKMIAYPMLTLFALKFSGLSALVPNGEVLSTISLLAAIAPTGASVTQMAQVYDKDSGYAGAIYFVTTLLCIATMPLMIWLYQM